MHGPVDYKLGRRVLHATIDVEREHNKRLSSENQRLQRELDQVKLELKLERQNKFATNQQKQDSGKTTETTDSITPHGASGTKKKRGAPVGHPGWFRELPTAYDWAVDVTAPVRCLHCCGQVSREVLGEHFTGTLVTDCYAGYEAHTAGAKQKCQAHLARTAHDWQKLTNDGSTNNLAERALRPMVVLRKITFGHRSHAGAVRMGRLMTVAETAKRHGHRPLRQKYP